MKQLLAGILLAVSLAMTVHGATPERPDIIVLLADDMRWDAMSCAGHPILKTPNLDRLAAGGTRFYNAFVTTSICCVSRASILTGQYARRHGVHDFKTPVENLDSMYPMLLRRGGYHTGFIGKWGIAAASGVYFERCAAAFDFWAGNLGQTYEHLYEHGPRPPLHIEPCEGVRTRDWKYFVWLNQTGPAREEPYALRADPLEMTNLVSSPAAAAKLEELRRRHADLAQKLQ